MHFVLGKVYADCGRIEESANHYRQGNALRRAQFQNPDGWKLDIGPTHQVFTSDLCNSAPTNSAGDITPIFIVGLPRCGSTLLEEVLGAHPDVQVYGEKDYFADSLFEILEHRTGTRSLTNFAALTDTDLQDIRLSYIEKLERHVPARPFIVDKALQNLRHVGAIRFVFPQARIIHSVRDFRDQGLSIFFNYFGEEEKQQYAYDLDDIVERARQFDALARLWSDVLPGFVNTLSYEILVDDFEPGVRELLTYCGLTWHDGCLDFQSNKRFVMTLSAYQVREKVSKRYIGRWKRYESYISPLVAYADERRNQYGFG